MIKVGFLPNISDEGKDFVATWFPGFPLLSHPGQDIRLKKSGRNVAMMRRSDDGVLKQKVSIGNLIFQMI